MCNEIIEESADVALDDCRAWWYLSLFAELFDVVHNWRVRV